MTFDVDRVVPDDTIDAIAAEFHREFQHGSTVRDFIQGLAGIGYGGHFWETFDEEDDIYGEIALDDEEREAIRAWRHAYGFVCFDVIEEFVESSVVQAVYRARQQAGV